VQCSAVQCSAVQCSAVQCSAVQCSPPAGAHYWSRLIRPHYRPAGGRSAVQCSAVQCSAGQCSAVQCSKAAPVTTARTDRFVRRREDPVGGAGVISRATSSGPPVNVSNCGHLHKAGYQVLPTLYYKGDGKQHLFLDPAML
jgi:hypothetical protein